MAMSKKSKLTIGMYQQQRAKDCHHIFFQARHWKRGALLSLRRFHYCRLRIDRDTLHREIHHRLKDVPPPKPINALEALSQLRYLEKFGAISDEDGFAKRLVVLIALFEDIEPQTARALQKQLEIVCEFKIKPS
jgi:hypothetical protein